MPYAPRSMPKSVRQRLLDFHLVRRALRFALSGMFVTLLYSLIAAGLIEGAALRSPVASGIAFVVATLTSYLVNTYWSFSRQPGLGNLMRFSCIALVGLFLTISIASLVDSLGLSYWIGIGCVVLVVPPVTFLLHNFWTYRL